MFATLYTSDSLPCAGMRNRLHTENPQKTLSERLDAAFKKRGLSSRKVGKKVGVSNRTVQNLVNGTGNPGLANLIAVAKHLQIPLWQLLCPEVEAGRTGEVQIHDLIEAFCSLSDVGKRRLLQNLEDIVIAEEARRSSPSPSSSRNAT